MRIESYELYGYSLPYRRRVKWFNSSEAAGEFVALRLLGDAGARGVAEAPVKPTWGGLSPRSLVALVEDILLPALADVDVSDLQAVRTALSPFPGNQLAKMLVTNACATLAAASTGQPLWRSLGGTQSVEVSWCVTRQPPADMAAEAEAMITEHGFRSLKLKGGQGFDTDREVLRAVRRVVGSDTILTVDANGAYTVAEAPDYVRLIADEGAVIAEDPAPYKPDGAFAKLVSGSPVPILVDSPCISVADADAFLAAGARAVSVKPGRVGFAEAGEIAKRARAAGAQVGSGMYAESAFGTLLSLQFSAALPDPIAAAEQSFYLLMTEQVLKAPLVIAGGRVELPESPDLDALVDWAKLTPLH